MTAPYNKWFEQEDYAKFECGHFRRFERDLDWILQKLTEKDTKSLV